MIQLDPGQKSPVSEILAEALVCPLDHSDLAIAGNSLICMKCGQVYEIIDGVPNMLVEDD